MPFASRARRLARRRPRKPRTTDAKYTRARFEFLFARIASLRVVSSVVLAVTPRVPTSDSPAGSTREVINLAAAKREEAQQARAETARKRRARVPSARARRSTPCRCAPRRVILSVPGRASYRARRIARAVFRPTTVESGRSSASSSLASRPSPPGWAPRLADVPSPPASSPPGSSAAPGAVLRAAAAAAAADEPVRDVAAGARMDHTLAPAAVVAERKTERERADTRATRHRAVSRDRAPPVSRSPLPSPLFPSEQAMMNPYNGMYPGYMVRVRSVAATLPRASALPARSEIALARSEATTGEKNIFPSSPIAHLLPSLSLFFSLRALDTAPRTRAPTRAPRSRPRLGRRASTPRSSRSGSRLSPRSNARRAAPRRRKPPPSPPKPAGSAA